MVMAWIRLLGLPGYLYKKKIIEEIEGTIGKVLRLDFNTDSRARGRFARMAVYNNLDKPLIAQVRVNGLYQKVEYEGLPTICFTCRKYGHTKELCGSLQPEASSEKDQSGVTQAKEVSEGESAVYGPWMVVEKKAVRNFRSSNSCKASFRERKSGSRFDALVDMEVLDLEAEINKGNEGQTAELKDIFKSGKFIENLRMKNWENSISERSRWGLLMRMSVGQLVIKAGQLGQEESVGDGSNAQTMSISSMSEPVDIQVADFPGGFNSNRHTAVSFNVKGTAGGDPLKKTNVISPGVSMVRSAESEAVAPDPGKRIQE
ncbi:hypothetical protein PVK06_043511 [Gossypium arboreum]|uniref:DUF4283 domain-containing protein n=1 Tax=Gossypium arboreum TaxID=29729 RepID=A0ABR0MNP6_GOSAR|nr:hypothetical protein PVK06_043511 [Gossypium arboreum]